MSAAAQVNPLSGIWPLGLITVTTAGTPVNLNTRVGAQKAVAGTRQYPSRVRQIIFSTPGGTTGRPNAGNIYISYQGATKSDVNNVVLVIPPGAQYSIPHGLGLEQAAIVPDNFSVDADVNGDGVYVSAVVQ